MTRLPDNVYTLWKRSNKNPKVDTAFFRFFADTWLTYISDSHNEIKSLLMPLSTKSG